MTQKRYIVVYLVSFALMILGVYCTYNSYMDLFVETVDEFPSGAKIVCKEDGKVLTECKYIDFINMSVNINCKKCNKSIEDIGIIIMKKDEDNISIGELLDSRGYTSFLEYCKSYNYMITDIKIKAIITLIAAIELISSIVLNNRHIKRLKNN